MRPLVFLLLAFQQAPVVANQSDVLAEVHALTAAVHAVLSSASAMANVSGDPSIAAMVEAIVNSSVDSTGTAMERNTYDTVLAAFEDGSHPMLSEEDESDSAAASETLQAALRREKLRREQAELALEGAMQRVKRAERRLARMTRMRARRKTG